MPQLDPQLWKKLVRRAIIIGPTNSWKTASLRTWPSKGDGTTHGRGYLIYPGETGFGTILQGEDDFVWYWSDEEIAALKTPANLIKDVEAKTWDLIAGKLPGQKNGPITTFCGEGLHQLHKLYINKASDGAFLKGLDFEAKAYGPATNDFFSYLNKLIVCPVPYVVCTAWEAREADNPTLGSRGPSHIYGDFAGKVATRIPGIFPISLYASVQVAGLSEPKGTWQIRPGGEVWGVGAKLPVEVAKTLPVKVPQDWQALEKLLLGGANG
jgi:hypothetical protein